MKHPRPQIHDAGDGASEAMQARLRSMFTAVKAATPAVGRSAAISAARPAPGRQRVLMPIVASAAAVAALVAGIAVVASRSAGTESKELVVPAGSDPRVEPSSPGSEVFLPEHLEVDGYLLPAMNSDRQMVGLTLPEVAGELLPTATGREEIPFGEVARDTYNNASVARPYALGTFTDPKRPDFWAVPVIADAANGVDGMLGMVADGPGPELGAQPITRYRDPFGRNFEGFRWSASGIEVAVAGVGITNDDLEMLGEFFTNPPINGSGTSEQSRSEQLIRHWNEMPEIQGGLPEGVVLQYSPAGWVRTAESRVPEMMTLSTDFEQATPDGVPTEVVTVTQSLSWSASEVVAPFGPFPGTIAWITRDGVKMQTFQLEAFQPNPDFGEGQLGISDPAAWIPSFVGVNRPGYEQFEKELGG